MTCLSWSMALAAVCALAVPATAAQLYQWQDENGVVHYTDKPPQGIAATKRHVKAPPQIGNATDDKEETEEETPKNANAQRCETEQKRLKVLQSNTTVRMRNDDGTVRELNREEMQEEIGYSKAAIARYCKPDGADD